MFSVFNHSALLPIRKLWRAYLIIYRSLFQFFLLFFVLILYPFLLILSFASRNKGSSYFVGIHEIASNIFTTTSALKDANYDVRSLAIVGKFDCDKPYKDPLFIPNFLKKLNNIRNIYIYCKILPYFINHLFQSKYFILFWNLSFLPFGLDLLLLKIANKKVILFHCGDDVRYRPIHNKLMELSCFRYSFPLLDTVSSNMTFIKKFYYQKLPSFLRISVYTLMNQETFLDRPVYQFRVPQIDNIKPDFKKKNNLLKIVHAPTERNLKGTKVVLDTINKLRSNGYSFNFHLIENCKNSEVINLLKTTDIIIDQPGLWGRFAIEGMAHSCIVIGGNAMQYEKGSIQLPIIPFEREIDDLYAKVRFVLEHKDLKSLQNASYQCYQRFYSPSSFVTHLNGVFEGTIKPDLFPHENHKQKLLEAAENSFQRLIIKLFIKD